MRSKNRTVEVIKRVNFGHMPVFVSMMHRHLEKERPAVEEGKIATFQVPVDMLKLTISDQTLIKEIESVELTYRPFQGH